MEDLTSSTVQSLNASGSSKVHVGNSYNITHHHGRGSEDDGAKKYLDALRSTDPRDDKARIEQTNGGLLKDSYVWILDSPEFITWRDESKTGRLLWIRGDPAILKGLIYLLVIQHPTAVSHLDDKQDKGHWNYKVSLESTFRKILDDPGLGETYLLVDALDECVEDLPLLLALISSTSSRAKWIATSRNRCEIEELFGEASSKLALSLELHEGSVSRAVDSYIKYRTRQLAERKKLKKSTLQQILDHLSQHAHGTFLWVALGLNQLYAKMMDQIHKSDSCDLYIRILAVASTVFRPLTFAELIAMEDLQMDEELVPDLIVECGSFLTTKGSSVVFIHQSAKDFLLKDSSALLFQSGLVHYQYDLFQRCIAMLQSLQQDIYGLVHPGVSLKEALRNCPNPDPLENIKYSCVFWADHMQEAYKLSIQAEENSDISGMDTVHDFINEKFLFWLEALVLCQNLPAALKALVFLRDLPVLGQGSYKALIKDALRFSHHYGSIIENYPLQIYASGLLFSPDDSLIRRQFKQYTSKIFSQSPKVDEKWCAIQSTYESVHHGFYIEAMSFAPSSQMLVVITDTVLTRWHISQQSVPDVMERDDRHVIIASSSDGKWLAIIASELGYDCDTEQPPAQCEIQIHDWTLNRITWRQELEDTEALGKQYDNTNWKDDFPIRDTNFIPNTHLLMLCDSRDNIHLWNVVEQKCEVWCHIEYSFSRFAISHSGSWMLLSGEDGLIICDRASRRVRRVTSLPWPPGEQGIAISYDDQTIACGFMTGLWILDVNALLADERPTTRNTHEIFHISDNGQLIAYDLGRYIEVWDAVTSVMLCTLALDDVNHGSTRTMAFAPKDRYLLCLLAFDSIWRTIKFSARGFHMTLDCRNPILGWDLADESSQRVLDRFVSGPIAVSDKGYEGDRWAAACLSSLGVSVWNFTNVEEKRTLRSPNSQSREAASIAFAGNQLGILWNSEKGLPDTPLFLLYDVSTGQQLYGIDFMEYYDGKGLSLFKEPKLQLSLRGAWVLIHPGPYCSLFLWNVSTGGKVIEVDHDFHRFFLIDDSTV
ncbi:heterokaryon incompatibility protein het-E-1 [Fusarium denticulatum]|uniref:Heterokaryon incompatibility protein het-E-1 n=1 Tax=Fusarium denticulatum TaxID=48507 RepID=A0A8H5XJT3_9HYPO|nr:heterokaryon incompatibility protein het-E-1 [Fusarium denticulatum]